MRQKIRWEIVIGVLVAGAVSVLVENDSDYGMGIVSGAILYAVMARILP